MSQLLILFSFLFLKWVKSVLGAISIMYTLKMAAIVTLLQEVFELNLVGTLFLL